LTRGADDDQRFGIVRRALQTPLCQIAEDGAVIAGGKGPTIGSASFALPGRPLGPPPLATISIASMGPNRSDESRR